MNLNVEDIMFEMWWSENKSLLSDKVSKEVIEMVWKEQFVAHPKDLDRKEKVVKSILERVNLVCDVIEKLRKDYSIPAADNWQEGIKGIAKYCEEINNEVISLRKENNLLTQKINDLSFDLNFYKKE